MALLLAGILCGAVLILGSIAIGIYLIYQSVQNRKKAEFSKDWPSTVGQIIESKVDQSTSPDSDGTSTDSYTPTVEYTYQVAGQTFTGRDITFGFKQGFGKASKAQSMLAKYPVGAQVSVYYNPADPGQAVLERQAGGFGSMLALGIIFLVIGLCLSCGGVLALIYGFLVPVSQ